MATHNRRRFLPEAVACFLAQTISDSELIVIDDGTDPVRELIPVGPRFHYLRREPEPKKHRLCTLREIGRGVARGKYHAVWDDDDLYHPERLAAQIEALERAGAGLCLLASSIVRREDPPGEWVYTPSDPYRLDNAAVFLPPPTFTWDMDLRIDAAPRVLKAVFNHSLVVLPDRPDLMITRRHGHNTCGRDCGLGPEWQAVPPLLDNRAAI
jgi:glycosyltransferase involved in cell wall biosynthesis